MTEVEKHQKINELLRGLSESPVRDAESLLSVFSSIYCEGYRHSYASVARVLMETEREENDFIVVGIQELINELDKRVERGEGDGLKETHRSLKKLHDHISLELIRLSQYKEFSDSTSSAQTKVDKLQSDYSKLLTDSRNIAKKTTAAEKSIKDFNTQSITVLGIFSGIVMAFTGSFSLLGNALTNINAVSKYRLFFMTLLLGFVLFNTIFMLMYIIARITDHKISTKCTEYNTIDCECDVPCSNRRWGTFKKLKRRYPYVLFVNSTLLFFMIAIFILWFLRRDNQEFQMFCKIIRYIWNSLSFAINRTISSFCASQTIS